MKLQIVSAVLVFAAVPAFGQMSGVSSPDPAVITATPDAAPKPMKPSPAIPAVAPATTTPEVYGAYVPYHAPGTAAVTPPLSKAAYDPDANFVSSVKPPEKYSGFVTSVPEKEGEIREGTLLKARITQTLTTGKTVQGSEFKAELTQAVEKDGRVILPVGAVLEGRVTQVRSGRRISGAAMMHLEPFSVLLPDGTLYTLHAQLIDTNQSGNTRVGSEGNVLRRDHAKETFLVIGGVTGAGAIAGAAIGGGVGAAVGAGIGAGAGTIVWLKQTRQATLPQNSLLVFSLTTPMELKPLHAGVVGGQ
jgi:hypothetical protein